MTTVTLNDYTVDFDAAVQLMDDDIREMLHDRLAPCDEQAFLDAYVTEHFAKFGETFRVA